MVPWSIDVHSVIVDIPIEMVDLSIAIFKRLLEGDHMDNNG
jgi:hypothetical protein